MSQTPDLICFQREKQRLAAEAQRIKDYAAVQEARATERKSILTISYLSLLKFKY